MMTTDEQKDDPAVVVEAVAGATKEKKDRYFIKLRMWNEQTKCVQKITSNYPMLVMMNYVQILQQQQQQQRVFNQTQVPNMSTQPVPAAAAAAAAVVPPVDNQNRPLFARIGLFQLPFNGIRQPQPLDRNQNIWTQFLLENEQIISEHGGYEYVIASLWKRVGALIIDLLVWFLILWCLISLAIDVFIGGLVFSQDKLSITIHYLQNYSVYVKYCISMIICGFEIWATMYGPTHRLSGSATIGKLIVGIRVIHVTAFLPLTAQRANEYSIYGERDLNNNNDNNNNNIGIHRRQLNRAAAEAAAPQPHQQPQPPQINDETHLLLHPAENLKFSKSLCRSLMKNIPILLFLLTDIWFPIIIFTSTSLFKHNLTIYDVMVKTFVVEENRMPILRRRRQQ